jgi:hypothetical protein
MFSGVSPGLYIAAQAIVEYIPVLLSVLLGTELPLSIVDGFTFSVRNGKDPRLAPRSSTDKASVFRLVYRAEGRLGRSKYTKHEQAHVSIFPWAKHNSLGMKYLL